MSLYFISWSFPVWGLYDFASSSSRTAFGNTREYIGDSTQLLYLRARHYAPGMGRFLTRDTWEGNANSPMSFNKWNYTLSNPTNYTDPSGECSYLPADNIKYIEQNAGSFLNKSNWLDTYTAAGIAVQCWAEPLHNDDDYDGYGPAQITNMQVSTAWGDTIEDPNGGDPRGYGLLCYIIKRSIPRYRTVISCTICENEAYMINNYGVGNYQRETPHNQSEMRWAVEYMRREIKLILDVCERDRKCLDTDKFIAAARGQNGPGFNIVSMKFVPKLDHETPDYKLDWKTFFANDNSLLDKNTRIQLTRFNQAIEGLIARNWTVPARDTNYIHQLISGNYK